MPESAENKERRIRIGNLTTTAAILRELRRLYRVARNNELDTLDASRLGSLLRMMVDIMTTDDIEQRLTKLEANRE